MKIVHVASSAPYNDNWGYQDNLLPSYHQKAGHETVVVTTNLTHGEGKIVPVPCGEYVLEDGVRVIRLARKDYGHRVLTSLNSRLEVYGLLTRLRPDFIFFHGLVSSSTLWYAGSHVPDQRLNPPPLHCKAESQPLDHQERPCNCLSIVLFLSSYLPTLLNFRPFLSLPWTV